MDFLHIIERIKKILGTSSKKNKIYDRDVAQALKLDPQYFAVIKRRNKIPYESIAYFCNEANISINWILFGTKVNCPDTHNLTA